MKITIQALVEGGKASAGPPLGPAIAPLGVNVGLVVAKINGDTKKYEGLSVPLTLTIHSDKTFDVVVGSPPASALNSCAMEFTPAASSAFTPWGHRIAGTRSRTRTATT